LELVLAKTLVFGFTTTSRFAFNPEIRGTLSNSNGEGIFKPKFQTSKDLRKHTSLFSSVVEAQEEEDFGFDLVGEDTRAITLSERALSHLADLRLKQGNEGNIMMRMGVKSGGCSGMSYVMDFMKEEELTEEDYVEEWSEHGFRCAIDPKSLLYLYGLELDYSDELIGGGFQFRNPNAEQTCGCGKSFGV